MNTTDTILSDLSDFLLLNASFSIDNSLQSGKLAVALFFYHAQQTGLVCLHPAAGDSFLEEIISEPAGYNSISLATGLSGGGVVLSHIVQEGLGQAPVALLQDLEPYLLDLFFSSIPPSTDVAGGISGTGLYLLYRLNDPLVKEQGSQDFYIRHLRSCGQLITEVFRAHQPPGHLAQAEAAIWNGLSGTLIFLGRINELGLGDSNTGNVEKEIAMRLLRYTEEESFNWHKAEAFTGLLNGSGNNSVPTDRLYRSFTLFVDRAFGQLERIDLRHAAFIALLIRIAGRKCDHAPAAQLSEAICNHVRTVLATADIARIFNYDPAAQTFQMGVHRGVCGTALSLLSLATGNYSWLKILGISVTDNALAPLNPLKQTTP